MGILRRVIADEDLLWLLETIVRSEDTKFGIPLGDHGFECERVEGIGMPIGNLTSQMFANLYLNELDQYAKHVLKVQYYIRYMDDVVILHPDKKYLWRLKEEIGTFLEDYLHLVLNNKTTVRTVGQGIDFCGYRIWPTHRKLRKKTALKMKRRLKHLQQEYSRGNVSFDKVNASVQSYLGLLKHCNSYNLRRNLFKSFALTRGR
jgi:hypothetical protein